MNEALNAFADILKLSGENRQRFREMVENYAHEYHLDKEARRTRRGCPFTKEECTAWCRFRLGESCLVEDCMQNATNALENIAAALERDE